MLALLVRRRIMGSLRQLISRLRTNSASMAHALQRRRALILISLALLLLPPLSFYALRRYEYAVTFHPTPYEGGSKWEISAGTENVWFDTSDGSRLHGWFMSAARNRIGLTVIYLHGNAGNIGNVKWIGEGLARRGLDVLLFDYRGYGRSEGETLDEVTINADSEAAYQYLVASRGIDPQKLILYGQSLGSTAAVDLASRRACAALIVESGPSSASSVCSVWVPWLPSLGHGLLRNRFDSAAKIRTVRRPVLIMHGDADEVIPVEQGKSLHEAANDPKELRLVSGAGHELAGFGGDAHLDSVADFINRHLVEAESGTRR